MSLINIMLVEDDADICEGYRFALYHNDEMKIVYETDSEQDGVNFLREHAVDVVILDLELREGDGTSFLDQLKDLNIEKPFIMVVTNTSSNIMLNLVRQNGADYIYQKSNLSYSPVKILSLVKKVMPYKRLVNAGRDVLQTERDWEEENDRVTKRRLSQELTELGFRASHIGTLYLQELLFLTVSGKQRMSKSKLGELYAMVGKKYKTSDRNVEHAVRTAIENTWKTSSVSCLQRNYPFVWDENKGKPTNREFIANMTEHLRKWN